jgi:hypothetical protein
MDEMVTLGQSFNMFKPDPRKGCIPEELNYIG